MDMPATAADAATEEPQPNEPCHSEVKLAQIQRRKPDKLGNMVREILWYGMDYIIYRTDKGVYVHFSNCPRVEACQRAAFREIAPDLCELRFLTHEMRRTKSRWYRFWNRRRRADAEGEEGKQNREGKDGKDGASLFDFNIAQAIMLLLESRPLEAKADAEAEPDAEARAAAEAKAAAESRAVAKAIAGAALAMAVIRTTNDNTLRYVRASMVATFVLLVAVGLVMAYAPAPLFGTVPTTYPTAALFGVIGAAFSVITRVQSFRMKPCRQSNMNYVMAWIRILIGLVAGFMLYLVLLSPMGSTILNAGPLENWKMAALIGFLGGFAERLVPTVFRRTAAALEETSGTPVQAVRKFERIGNA